MCDGTDVTDGTSQVAIGWASTRHAHSHGVVRARGVFVPLLLCRWKKSSDFITSWLWRAKGFRGMDSGGPGRIDIDIVELPWQAA